MLVLTYIGKRLLQSIVVLFLVSIIAFMLIRLAPGNPAELMLTDLATAEQIREMEQYLGLDLPLPVQYGRYLSGVLRGDLGISTAYRMPVSQIIPPRLAGTVLLSVSAIACGILLSVPLGIIAGSRRGSPTDFFAMSFSLVGQSMSGVWLSVFLVYVFAVRLGWFPTMGTGSIRHLILPMLTMAYPMGAAITRLARSGMIDALGQDYITSTRAKGIRKIIVEWKYAFKNALIPVVTIVGLDLAQFLAGAVVVEAVFSWPGLGQLLYQSVQRRDYAVVQSLLLLSAVFFVGINLIVDIINSFIDRRIVLK